MKRGRPVGRDLPCKTQSPKTAPAPWRARKIRHSQGQAGTNGLAEVLAPPGSSVVKQGGALEPGFGLPCGSEGKESTCNAGDLGSISRLGRSPEEGKGYLLQCSGLENSMDCRVHGVIKSQT